MAIFTYLDNQVCFSRTLVNVNYFSGIFSVQSSQLDITGQKHMRLRDGFNEEDTHLLNKG